jgi:hypothetical protein
MSVQLIVYPQNQTTASHEGQVIVDLYEDEDIPLTLSVDNFKDMAEQVQSYSKSFNLPATKRNNQIFTNLFEVTMVQDVYSFNPYMQTPCVLKQNGFILFKGYLRLVDIQDKEAEISYNVNLYSEVVALKDILENKVFRDLDFTELEHPYNIVQIKKTWLGQSISYSNPSTSGLRDVDTLKYPFVDWTHQYIANYGGSSNTMGILNLESTFRPFINIKYLLDRIFQETNFTYESDFFNTTDFKNLYMDFNWGGDDFPFTIDDAGQGSLENQLLATSSYAMIPLDSNTFGDNFGYSGGAFTALLDNQSYDFAYNFVAEVIYDVSSGGSLSFDFFFQWKKVRASDGFISYHNLSQHSGSGNSSGIPISGNLTITLNTGDILTPEWYSLSTVTHYITLLTTSSTYTTVTTAVTSADAVTNNIFLQTLRGELGQWDFLKGIMTMFNIVSLPDKDNPNNIKFEPYNTTFITDPNIVTHDWTDKVDVSEMKLTPLTELNKTTIFKFVEDDDDYIFNVYKKSVGGHLYGSKIYDASGLTLLQGTNEIVAEPFAATIIKPLMSQYSSLITPAIYSMGDDGTTEGFENSPRIMYNNGNKGSGINIHIPEQNGEPYQIVYHFLQFSHLTDISTLGQSPYYTATRDFHFGECQLIPPVGAAVPDNLFNLYWLPYYSELYNSNTRVMSLKVALSPSDVNIFKFNDKVFIKNRTYRVNKIDYKPNDLAKVEFILLP